VDEYAVTILDIFHYSGIDEKKISAIAVASVVPLLDNVFAELTQSILEKGVFYQP
jgi:pantothenate kinase type III